MGASSGTVSARANGLASQFRKGTTVLGLHIALKILHPLELLNCSLQSRSMTVAGMMTPVNEVVSHLQSLRCQAEFNTLLECVNGVIRDRDLEPISVPRQRRPPARLTGGADAYEATSV